MTTYSDAFEAAKAEYADPAMYVRYNDRAVYSQSASMREMDCPLEDVPLNPRVAELHAVEVVDEQNRIRVFAEVSCQTMHRTNPGTLVTLDRSNLRGVILRTRNLYTGKIMSIGQHPGMRLTGAGWETVCD